MNSGKLGFLQCTPLPPNPGRSTANLYSADGDLEAILGTPVSLGSLMGHPSLGMSFLPPSGLRNAAF